MTFYDDDPEDPDPGDVSDHEKPLDALIKRFEGRISDRTTKQSSLYIKDGYVFYKPSDGNLEVVYKLTPKEQFYVQNNMNFNDPT